MKFPYYLFLLGLSISSFAQNSAIISIQNNSKTDRKEAFVAIQWEAILEKFLSIDSTHFVVMNVVKEQQIPFQLEHKGKKSIQNLLIQVDVKSKSTLNVSIQKGKPVVFETKTFGRYVPERKDDFAWENDKIAHRVYRKALDLNPTEHPAKGIDVWVERTNRMMINERYKRATALDAKPNEYHINRRDGLDYYQVEASLGAGSMTLYINDTIYYSKNYVRYKVLDNGPIRTSFELFFDAFQASNIYVNVTKIISIDSGSQWSRMENTYSFSNVPSIPAVIGIRKRTNPGVISLNEQEGIMGYWEPAFAEDGTTGVGVVLENLKNDMLVCKTAKGYIQILAKTELNNKEPIVYYSGAAWDKAGEITTESQWFDYLKMFSNNLKTPLVVSIH